ISRPAAAGTRRLPEHAAVLRLPADFLRPTTVRRRALHHRHGGQPGDTGQSPAEPDKLPAPGTDQRRRAGPAAAFYSPVLAGVSYALGRERSHAVSVFAH